MFCHENNDLVIYVSAASTRYFEACTELMHQAARGNPLKFKDLEAQCRVRRDDCVNAKEALRQHRAAHGC